MATNNRKMKSWFDVEITDTYAGESNYSWAERYRVYAISERGALRMANAPYYWRKAYNMGDGARYDGVGACVCAFVTYSDNQQDNEINQ